MTTRVGNDIREGNDTAPDYATLINCFALRSWAKRRTALATLSRA